jgi:hypothetical protein
MMGFRAWFRKLGHEIEQLTVVDTVFMWIAILVCPFFPYLLVFVLMAFLDPVEFKSFNPLRRFSKFKSG